MLIITREMNHVFREVKREKYKNLHKSLPSSNSHNETIASLETSKCCSAISFDTLDFLFGDDQCNTAVTNRSIQRRSLAGVTHSNASGHGVFTNCRTGILILSGMSRDGTNSGHSSSVRKFDFRKCRISQNIFAHEITFAIHDCDLSFKAVPVASSRNDWTTFW